MYRWGKLAQWVQGFPLRQLVGQVAVSDLLTDEGGQEKRYGMHNGAGAVSHKKAA